MADFGTPTIMFEVILFSDISVLGSMNYSAVLRALNDTDSSHSWVWRSLWYFSLIRALENISHLNKIQIIIPFPELFIMICSCVLSSLKNTSMSGYLMQEKGLCLPSPCIYIVAVGRCRTGRDAAPLPPALSTVWFTPENLTDLPSAAQRCLYSPFCRTAGFCFQKNS